MRRASLFALVVILVAGCVSATAASPDVMVAPMSTSLVPNGGSIDVGGTAAVVPISVSIPVLPDSAYKLLKAAYVKLEIPVTEEDPLRRLIGNDVYKVRRHVGGLNMQAVVFCGDRLGVANAETWEIQMQIRSYVVADGRGGSQLWTRIQALGHDQSGSSRDMSPCSTKGELELKIGNVAKLMLLQKR